MIITPHFLNLGKDAVAAAIATTGPLVVPLRFETRPTLLADADIDPDMTGLVEAADYTGTTITAYPYGLNYLRLTFNIKDQDAAMRIGSVLAWADVGGDEVPLFLFQLDQRLTKYELEANAQRYAGNQFQFKVVLQGTDIVTGFDVDAFLEDFILPYYNTIDDVPDANVAPSNVGILQTHPLLPSNRPSVIVRPPGAEEWYGMPFAMSQTETEPFVIDGGYLGDSYREDDDIWWLF